MAQVTCEIKGEIAYVTFDHVAARNAMTIGMYQSLQAICEDLAQNTNIRAVIFRGAGGKAFVSGSDIAQFATFTNGEDGLRYEAGIDAYFALNGNTVGDDTIEVIYRDVPQADPAQSKALAQELVVKEGVQYLAGFYFTPDAMAARRSRADSVFGRPTSGVPWRIWRCRLENSTRSSSTRPISPTPAAAR